MQPPHPSFQLLLITGYGHLQPTSQYLDMHHHKEALDLQAPDGSGRMEFVSLKVLVWGRLIRRPKVEQGGIVTG
jgi:hypothetical protein